MPALSQVQAACQTALITVLTDQIHTLEGAVQPALLDSSAVQRMLWIPGIGRLLAFTIFLEAEKELFDRNGLVPELLDELGG